MSWFSQKFVQLQNLFYGKTPVEATVDLNVFTFAELRAMAKTRGLTGYTQLRKAQLIEMIQEN